MKKIAILTIVSANYGNRLQNYALAESLKKLNFEVETIRRYPQRSKLHRIKNNIRALFKKDRFTNFTQFDNYIDWSDDVVNCNYHSPYLESHYDAFVIGSDQIWNLSFDFLNEYVFLPFVKNKRKIAYAASIGIDRYDDEMKTQATSIKYIDKIAVREESAVSIVCELTGKVPEIVIDPTMLLSAEEWQRIARKPKMLDSDEEYLFLYFLGKLSNEKKSMISRIAKEKNLKIYNILDPDDAINECGPAQFVYMISHSRLVVTDSFHACVFSILNHVPFTVLERESEDKNMNSRIVTLLRMFHLENHFLKSGMNPIDFDFFRCDYSITDQILEQKRDEAVNFLKEALADEK